MRPRVQRRTLVQGGLGLVSGALLGGAPDSLDIFATSRAPEQAPEPSPVPDPPPPPAELAYGMGGEAVWALQDQLNASGYWCGAPDGGFGHLTQQAVFAVQKAHGLQRDGIVGPATEAALATGDRPAPAAGGDHVEVHVGPQLILVVRGGATRMILNTSTGNGQPYDWYGQTLSAVTPPGSFSVFNTYSPGWQPGPLGDLYRPQYFNGGIAVHGSEYIPPWADSHGCARVSVAAMDMFWETGTMTMDTPVTVV